MATTDTNPTSNHQLADFLDHLGAAFARGEYPDDATHTRRLKLWEAATALRVSSPSETSPLQSILEDEDLIGKVIEEYNAPLSWRYPQRQILWRYRDALKSRLGQMPSVEPKSTQPPDSRGDAALWVLAWLAMKGGLGSDVHEVIEAVMEGRAEMRPNNKLHIEPRGAEKASECICPKRDTDDSIIYTHVACPTHALNGSANEGKS